MPFHRKDITGERIGSLVAESEVGANQHGQTVWRFRCDCGGTRDRVPASLRLLARKGRPVVCECNCPLNWARKKINKEYGLWTVLGPGKTTKSRHLGIRCRCEGCGVESTVLGAVLRNGKSSGCFRCTHMQSRIAVSGDGQRLRDWRIAKNLTLGEAAARIGVSKQRWGQYEKKMRISPETMSRLTGEI